MEIFKKKLMISIGHTIRIGHRSRPIFGHLSNYSQNTGILYEYMLTLC